MKHHLNVLGAGLFSLGALALISGPAALGQEVPAQQPPVQQQQNGDRGGLLDPGMLPGVAPDADRLPVSATEANNIRGTLAAATEAAMTRGQLRSVAQRLTTPDEARLREFVRQDHPQLDGLIEQIEQAWQQRYNERFNIRDRAAVYPAEIVRMELGVTEQALALRSREARSGAEAQLAGDQPHNGLTETDRTDRPELQERGGDDAAARVEGQIGQPDGQVRIEAQPQREITQPRDLAAEPADLQPRLTAQSNVVTIIFPAAHGLPEVHVPLINEGTLTDSWRIDIPLDIDGQRVHDNLVRYMGKSLAQREQWPADVNEAYRTATHMVVAALLDVKDLDAAQPAAAQIDDAEPPIGTPQPQAPTDDVPPGDR